MKSLFEINEEDKLRIEKIIKVSDDIARSLDGLNMEDLTNVCVSTMIGIAEDVLINSQDDFQGRKKTLELYGDIVKGLIDHLIAHKTCSDSSCVKH